MPLQESIITAWFLCSHKENELIREQRPEWLEPCAWSFEKKCSLLSLDPARLFPFTGQVSKQIDIDAFRLSMLEQPDLFIRVRPEYKKTVTEKLEKAGILFERTGTDGIRMANTTRLDELFMIDREIVVQDMNSQRVGEVMKSLDDHSIRKVWDCCAASGGKSILVWDILGPLELTVSDVRKNILANLEKRFAAAGITIFKRFQADISSSDFKTGAEAYDLLIADVPCSGSGTWARTPEQLYYFHPEKVADFQAIQRKIIANTWEAVKPGGYYLYITCSVFKQENEAQADFLSQQSSAIPVSMEYLTGYTEKADTLFYALFKKGS